MPKKPTYAGNDSTYASEYKSYLKSTDPYLTDEDIDFMAQLNLEDVKSVYKPPKPSISGTSVERPTKVISSDNSLLEMAKKLSEKKKAQQQAQQDPKFGNQFLDVAKDVTERKQNPKLPAQYVEGASQISPIQEAMKVEPEYEVTPFPEGVDMGEPSVGRQFKGYVKPLSEQVKPQPIMTTQQRDAVGVNMKVPQPSQGGLPSVTKPIEDNFMSTANKRFAQFKLEREPEMPIPVDMANQKQAQDISEYLKSKQPADLGTLMAKKELPKGTKRQIQAYANAFNENVRRKEEFVAQKASELLPDNEFEKAINRKDLETQDRGTLIAQKYGGDAENINRELRDYMNSPMFKVDALKYARNKGELNQGAQIALDAKAEELAGLPSKFQQTATKIMSDLQQVPIIGSSVVNAARGVEGLLRAPMEIASGIYSGLEAIQGAGEQLMANKKPNIYELFAQRNKENLKKVSNVVPDLRPEDRKDNKLAQFFGDLASSLGYIEGGVLSTQKMGSVFGAAREAAAAGTTGQEAIGLANAARLSGKTRTVADKTLQSIQDVLRTKGAIKTAEFLDNAAKNAVMMAPALIENNSQTYIDAGFSSEEAAEKAAQKSMINVLGLSLPGVLRSSETGAIKNILGKGAERKVKGALKQGIHFGGDMALIRSAERAFDKANGIETEINAAEEVKAGFHDIALGISLNLLSGGSGRRIISEKQRISIADAIENRQALNEDIERNKRNPQEIAAVNSLLNTLTPYYKEAKERGYDKQQSVAYATEVARYNQAQKKMQPLLDLMTTGKATAQQEAEYKKYKAAQLKAEKAIKQVIEKGTIYDNRYLTSNDILDIVREQSPNKELKPQQDLKLEFNAPYQANEVVVADFANDPEVIAAKKELEASGATQELLEKMVVDNTPVVGTGNEILDGKKVMAAAEMIKLETIEVLESKTIEEIKEEANEAAEGIVSGEKNKEGLDEVAAKALDEMAERYEQHLEKNEGDFVGAVQEVVKDGLERGYGKEEIINMVDRVDDAKPISDPIVERLVNEETLKAQGASSISELLRMESERLESEGGELVEGVVKETEQKIQPNDTENTKGLSSEVGERKEPIKAEPIEGASGKEIEASGVLEGEGKVEEVEDLLGVKEKPIEEVKAEPIEEKVVEQELEESKSAFEKTLDLHKKKLEAKYESKKAKIEEEAKKVYEDKPEVQLLSENFKKILLKLKEAGEIEVRNIEDC